MLSRFVPVIRYSSIIFLQKKREAEEKAAVVAIPENFDVFLHDGWVIRDGQLTMLTAAEENALKRKRNNKILNGSGPVQEPPKICKSEKDSKLKVHITVANVN